ncbi:MAG: DUF998 domain-containing protein [archaeon]|nr:DUF998 domain-containing protein [archaeon]
MISNPFRKTNADGTLEVVPSFIVAGYLTAIVFFTIWIVSAAIDGHWVFGWNALSDLGVGKDSMARIFFNYGCVITAFCGGIFGMGLIKYERGCLYLSGIMVVIGIVFLMGVGAIPESYGAPHGACASTFGGFACIGMVLSTIGDFRAGRRNYSLIAVILLLISLGLQLSMLAFGLEFGYAEAICIINILIWVLSQSIKYHKLIGTITIDDPIRKIFDNL